MFNSRNSSPLITDQSIRYYYYIHHYILFHYCIYVTLTIPPNRLHTLNVTHERRNENAHVFDGATKSVCQQAVVNGLFAQSKVRQLHMTWKQTSNDDC